MLGEPNLWAEQSFSIGAYKSWPSPCYIFYGLLKSFEDSSNLKNYDDVQKDDKIYSPLVNFKRDRKEGGLSEEDDVEAIHWD